MALRIYPSNITFESVEKDDSIPFTVENMADKPVKYKFRLPPSRIVAVSKPTGTIPAGDKVDMEVLYYKAKNTLEESFLSVQLKSLCIDDKVKDTADAFEKNKDKVKTSYLGITFQDQMDLEDAMFKSPQASEKFMPEPSPKKWWKK